MALDLVAIGFTADSVAEHWPHIVSALQLEGIAQDDVLIAAAATLKTELGAKLRPVGEKYNGDPLVWFEEKYGPSTKVGHNLGNTEAGDGYRFRGRGFIQLTGRSNYTTYGKRLEVDLVTHPELALDQQVAARVFAAYFKDRGVAKAAMKQDWRAVRKLVNGGFNGWDVFSGAVGKLLTQPKPDFSDVQSGNSAQP